ncbi:MAG TPA: hypothetical protein VGI23_14410, partial [Steroidobacteraceae bacterium]
EAGRVLFGLGDIIRSYATYIRPGLVRSIAGGHHREAQQAAKLAQEVLPSMQKRIAETNGGSWQEQINRALDKHKQLMGEMNALFRGAPVEKDSLFAYSVANASEIIRSLADKDGISAEIDFVTNEYRALSSTNIAPIGGSSGISAGGAA